MNFEQQVINYLDIFIREKINLLDYAQKNHIPVHVNGNLDKGWRGNVIEHILNLKKNNNKQPDYENLEIKSVPVLLGDKIKVKETTCLCVLDTEDILKKDFEESFLYQKIKNTLFILIDVGDELNPVICKTFYMQLENLPDLKNQMQHDYELVSEHILDNLDNDLPLDHHLTGKLGEVIQPRPKTGKKGNYTWAFYLKTHVLNTLLNPVTNTTILRL